MRTRRSTAVCRVSILLVGTLLACGRKQQTPETRLRAAYDALARRPVELRLIGFPHRPVGTDVPLALRAASHEFVNAKTTDVRLRAAALAFVNRRRDAISLLRTALLTHASDASLWSDLAVYHFESARHQEEPRALGEALAAVDHAITLNPSLSEPRFNRARILDALQFRGMAATEWSRAASNEAGTPWAVEATANTKSHARSQREAWKAVIPQLEKAALAGDLAQVDSIVTNFTQEARTTAEGPVLATWAELYVSGEFDGAAKQRSVARAIGDSLYRVNREPLLRDAVMAIDRAGPRQRVLANAHVAYKRARVLIHERKPAHADASMAESERLFRAGGSPMEFVALAYRAGIAFDRNRIAAATTLLDSLERRLPSSYIAMRAQIQWDRARIASRRGDVYALLRHAENAAASYDQLHEHEFAVRMRSLIATAFTALGRVDNAWKVRLLTFADAEKSGNPDLIEHVLHAAAKEEILEKRHEVAASFFDLMLREPSRSPVRRFEALLWKAFVDSRRNRHAGTASRQLAAAAAEIQDDDLRATADVDRWFAEALLISDDWPEEALSLLTRTIRMREQRGLNEELPEAYVARGRLHRRNGAENDAQRDLEMALTTLEQRRRRVEPLALRDSFFAAADSACSELIELHVKRHDYAAAFLTAERCRARTILDITTTSNTRALDAEEVRRRLPENVIFLHYVTLRDAVLITSIARSAITPHLIAIPRSALQRDTAALLHAMQRRDDAAIERLTRSLHELLIAPVVAELNGHRLVICPDEILASVPYAALRNAEGKYVVENAPITIATSAASYVVADIRPPRHTKRALIVGDPAFDTSTHDLPRLPAAEAEARELSGIYSQAVLLTRRSATAERFLRELATSDVVHVASHAIISPRDAALSTLVFAPASGSNGLVYQSTIAGMRLERNPLVVLAGCRTASAAGGRGSIRSLALAFLAAGSSGVIGSLWDVEDQGARTVSRSLHRRLAAVTAAAALRDAQREMLHGNDPNLRSPAVWAAFQFIGFE